MFKRKVVFSFVFALLLIHGCKFSNGTELSAPQSGVPENPRRELLSYIALTGDYKVPEEKVREDLASFLKAMNQDSGGDAKTFSMQGGVPDFEISKIEEFKCGVMDGRTEKARGVSEIKADDIDFYLYKIKNPVSGKNGYAVTSGDRRIGEILAVIDEGEFEADISGSPFIRIFCTNLEAYINETLSAWYTLTDDDLKRAKARSAYEGIANSGEYTYSDWEYHCGYGQSCTLSTDWGQNPPYNESIKAVYGRNYLTGCTATAVAQVMAYHKYPPTCSSKILAKLKSKWDKAKDWDGKYDWRGMTRNRKAYYIEDKHIAQVAALMYEVAEGLHAEYGEKITLAYLYDSKNFLHSLGYTKGSYNQYSFHKIKESVDNKAPVLVSGFSRSLRNKNFLYQPSSPSPNIEKKGHAWVIDGYAKLSCTAVHKANGNKIKFTENYVHCNTGWDGYHNGYYINGVFSMNKGPLATNDMRMKVKVEPWLLGAIGIICKNNAPFSVQPDDANNYYRYDIEIMTDVRPK